MDEDSVKDKPLNKMLKQVSRKLEEKEDNSEQAFSDLGREQREGKQEIVCSYSMGLELAFVHIFKHEYLWNQLANHYQISSVTSLGWGIDCMRFWVRSDRNSGFHGSR